MKHPEQPELLPAEPANLTLDVRSNEASDRLFDLACRGYHVHRMTQIPHGYRLEARRCDCSVCLEGRRARAKTKAQAREDRPLTPAEGTALFQRLKESL